MQTTKYRIILRGKCLMVRETITDKYLIVEYNEIIVHSFRLNCIMSHDKNPPHNGALRTRYEAFVMKR